MKIVKNTCFGGFGLSGPAIERYLKLKGQRAYFYKQVSFRYEGKPDTYKRVPVEDTSMFCHVTTKNIGEITTDDEALNSNYFSDHEIERNDPALIQVVEELGDMANGSCAELEIVEVPDDIEWEIDEYDGIETIHELHRSW